MAESDASFPGSSLVRQPILFWGHGSPMNVIAQNPYTEALQREGRHLPKARAIIVISAHWETHGTRVLRVEHPRTIHDFSGFPPELNQITYPASGAPALADEVIDTLAAHRVKADTEWGLDHGVWAVLHHLRPQADMPVLPLSLNRRLSLIEHLELARSLKPLRDRGFLILASGNVTHNLGDLDWSNTLASFPWALEFDALIKQALIDRDEDMLLAQKEQYRDLWKRAHPRREHYLPLLYAYGASLPDEPIRYIYEGFELGSLSMRAVRWG